jgi:hypothetical protein
MADREIDSEIERPDEHKVADELYCWMPSSDDRECNGSCVAYDPTYTKDQFRDSCKWLNAFRSMAMSIAKISKSAEQQEKRDEIAARAALVAKMPNPPKV